MLILVIQLCLEETTTLQHVLLSLHNGSLASAICRVCIGSHILCMAAIFCTIATIIPMDWIAECRSVASALHWGLNSKRELDSPLSLLISKDILDSRLMRNRILRIFGLVVQPQRYNLDLGDNCRHRFHGSNHGNHNGRNYRGADCEEKTNQKEIRSVLQNFLNFFVIRFLLGWLFKASKGRKVDVEEKFEGY